MAEHTIYFDGTRAELHQLLRAFPAIVAGSAPDPMGIAKGIQLRVGVALLSKIQQAFIVKSRGGVGEDGIQWPALKRSTVAQRRTSASERKELGLTGQRTRGLLTPAQDKRWRALFAATKNQLMAKFGLSPQAAGARAAQMAWAVLKAEGAQTKLDTLGNRKVDTLRDTGELFRSLSPGVEDRPSGAEGQVFQVQPGRVIVGTNKKPWHHRGVPGKLPARHLWPPDGNLPDPWWGAILAAGQRGCVRGLVLLLERRAA